MYVLNVIFDHSSVTTRLSLSVSPNTYSNVLSLTSFNVSLSYGLIISNFL
jgi:hypothetical protein